MNSGEVNVLACQIEVPLTLDAQARDAHLAALAVKVSRKLKKGGVDIVTLPELSSIDYSRAAFDRLDELAEDLDGPSFRTWSKIGRDFGTHVLYSFPRRSENGFRIAVAVVDPQGLLIGFYDKLHLAQYGASMEKEYFSRGENLFVFEINSVRIAPIICYDIRIPDLSRTLTVSHGVDMIMHLGAYFRDESFYSWHHFVVSRAIENQIFFLSLNRAGENYGNSVYCAPWVDDATPPVRFLESGEDFKRLTARKATVQRIRSEFSFLSDTRKDYDLPLISSAAPLTGLRESV